jgi:zinc transporter ZupT
MTLLAAVIGLVVGFLLAGAADINSLLGPLFCVVGAVVGCLVVSDVVSGASRRDGGRAGALGFLISIAALVVVALALLLPVLTLVFVVALVWLGAARHRRAQRKHAGLRVLR